MDRENATFEFKKWYKPVCVTKCCIGIGTSSASRRLLFIIRREAE
jgi:hypothetical protein